MSKEKRRLTCHSSSACGRLADRGSVTLEMKQLVAHFEGCEVEDIIGLHAIGPDNTCRWIAWDIDHHDTNAPAPDTNERAAIALHDDLVAS